MDNNDKLRRQAEQQLDRLQRQSKTRALQNLKTMDPTVFEHLSALLFERRGFAASVVGTTGDQGVDLILHKDESLAIAQCKRYDGSVGQPTVRDLYGTMIHNGAVEAYLVTTGLITRQAQEWAAGKPIRFVDGFTLVDWIMAARSDSARRNSLFALRRRAPNGPAQSGSNARRRVWFWSGLFVLLVLLAVAAGISLWTLSSRLSDGGVADTIELPTPTRLPSTADSSGEPETPAVGLPTDANTTPAGATATPLSGPTETLCPSLPDDGFQLFYNRDALGCATSQAATVWAAWETFERGSMLWRSDTNAAYAFLGQNDGLWSEIQERWDGQDAPSRGEPPAGLRAPERGFGYVWSIRDDLFAGLGWATDSEKGFCAHVQSFQNGFILQSTPVESCTPEGLYNHATAGDWRPVTLVASELGESRWSNRRPETPNDAGAPTRPEHHGFFRATRAASIILDGQLDEWHGVWAPVAHVVHGAGNRDGARDLSGEFQARWSSDALILAVRTRDELQRAGPQGSNMWQGDGLEIHFDRLLAADFDDGEMSADDYQIGIRFAPQENGIPAYHWIPFDKEAALRLPGVARKTGQGIDLEVAIPWSTFDVRPARLSPGATFGFNLSINDNDSDTPAQQTIISASPARTDHQTPTEWGTLILEAGN